MTRVRFEGTKTGRQTDPFCFDRTFGDGLWAICTDKNDAGKTSVLVTVKIHKQNGQFQEERTYPSKDGPPRSKG